MKIKEYKRVIKTKNMFDRKSKYNSYIITKYVIMRVRFVHEEK